MFDVPGEVAQIEELEAPDVSRNPTLRALSDESSGLAGCSGFASHLRTCGDPGASFSTIPLAQRIFTCAPLSGTSVPGATTTPFPRRDSTARP